MSTRKRPDPPSAEELEYVRQRYADALAYYWKVSRNNKRLYQ